MLIIGNNIFTLRWEKIHLGEKGDALKEGRHNAFV